MDVQTLLAYREQMLGLQDRIEQFCNHGYDHYSAFTGKDVTYYAFSSNAFGDLTENMFLELVCPSQEHGFNEIRVPLSLLFMPEQWAEFWFKEVYCQDVVSFFNRIFNEEAEQPVIASATKFTATWLRVTIAKLQTMCRDLSAIHKSEKAFPTNSFYATYQYAWAHRVDSFYFDPQENVIITRDHEKEVEKRRLPFLLLAFSTNELRAFVKKNCESDVILLPHNGYWHPPEMHKRLYDAIFYEHQEDQCPEYFLNL